MYEEHSQLELRFLLYLGLLSVVGANTKSPIKNWLVANHLAQATQRCFCSSIVKNAGSRRNQVTRVNREVRP